MADEENFFERSSKALKKMEDSDSYKLKKKVGIKRGLIFIVAFFPVGLLFLYFKWHAGILVAYMLAVQVAVYALFPLSSNGKRSKANSDENPLK
jgi:hypothetical protein